MSKIKNINQGDVLTFIANDGKYKAIICTSVYKEKSPQNFTFATTTVDQADLPSIDEVIKHDFYGIGNIKAGFFKYSELEINNMWNQHPEIEPYHLGSYGLIIWRKDFMKFRDNFSLIGNLNIVDNLDKNGNGSMNLSDWTFLKDFFDQKFKGILLERGQNPFKMKAIIKKKMMR
ncbi:hypothetical protein [Echinicola shivajiensis]|uniref:hypothetical protein n=1 Tax=Echinicola shivajiensis TaxID=1035916 RepID=UPI001BFBFD51|nr:hypothetical protein [Echinicola shivajiensis]